jgi:hypothetical protein
LVSVPVAPVVVVLVSVAVVLVSAVALDALLAFLLQAPSANAAAATMTVTPSVLDFISRIPSFPILNSAVPARMPEPATAGPTRGSENVIGINIFVFSANT